MEPSASSIADSTDWLSTPLSGLAAVEAALRCQVCKDLYKDPMLTTCSHTFCSLCIHRCITAEGRCPLCRSPEDRSKLRRNACVDDLVRAFDQARPQVLAVGSALLAQQRVSEARPAKRRRTRVQDEEDDYRDSEDQDPEELDSDHDVQRRRSNPRTTSRPTRSRLKAPTTINLASSPDQSRTQDRSIGINGLDPHSPAIDDGLVACPICQRRMKEEQVYSHLESHPSDGAPPQATMSARPLSQTPHPSSNPPRINPVDRLPSLTYALFPDHKLRKKLAELGLASSGSRQLLMRRHTEWVNLVNANCDSNQPRSKRELLRDLDEWERTVGRSITHQERNPIKTGAIMEKDFDRAAWSSNHQSDFQDLVARARAQRTKAEPEKPDLAVAAPPDQESTAAAS